MTTSPAYVDRPDIQYCAISVANTNRDGTGALGTVCTGPVTAAGAGVLARIERVTIKAVGTTTAGMIRFFVSNDGGTTKRFLTEFPVTAVTPSASGVSFESTVPGLVGLKLSGGNGSAAQAILYAATEKAETFHVIAELGVALG